MDGEKNILAALSTANAADNTVLCSSAENEAEHLHGKKAFYCSKIILQLFVLFPASNPA